MGSLRKTIRVNAELIQTSDRNREARYRLLSPERPREKFWIKLQTGCHLDLADRNGAALDGAENFTPHGLTGY